MIIEKIAPGHGAEHGADFLVVGRPVNAVRDPKSAMDAIVLELEE